MSLHLSRVLTGLSTAGIRLNPIACRQKSTTSSIRAGLKAEQGGTGGYGGRSRPPRPGAGIGRPDRPFIDRSAPQGRYPSLERRGSNTGRSSFRPRDPSAVGPGRAFRDNSFERNASPSRQRGPFDDRPQRSREYEPRRGPPPHGRDALSGPAQRSQENRLRHASSYGEREVSARKERRAQFWAENGPKDEFDNPDEQPQRSFGHTDRAQHDSRRGERRPSRNNRQIAHNDDDVPMPVPYTTASSQFIYGANTVLAALRAKKRKLYKLYMHKRSEAENIAQVRRAATSLGIEIIRTADTPLMDRLSEGRPHNGVVLEVSAIPARPVLSLEKWDERAGMFGLELAEQDSEQASVNGTHTTMRNVTRNPLVIFLDGITDPGNVGNIIRTAHFFGADAVAIATQTCASISSPVLAKASAGACEAMPIFAVPYAAGFIFSSRQQGWTTCAAVAPADMQGDAQHRARQNLTTQQMAVDVPLAGKPCILMLGAEGEGLRDNLRKKADVFVTIDQTKPARASLDVGVDSLNVATAAALLINAFVPGLRQSQYHAKPGTGETELGI